MRSTFWKGWYWVLVHCAFGPPIWLWFSVDATVEDLKARSHCRSTQTNVPDTPIWTLPGVLVAAHSPAKDRRGLLRDWSLSSQQGTADPSRSNRGVKLDMQQSKDAKLLPLLLREGTCEVKIHHTMGFGPGFTVSRM